MVVVGAYHRGTEDTEGDLRVKVRGVLSVFDVDDGWLKAAIASGLFSDFLTLEILCVQSQVETGNLRFFIPIKG